MVAGPTTTDDPISRRSVAVARAVPTAEPGRGPGEGQAVAEAAL